METKFFAILFMLMVCHYLADFTVLSTGWMLKAKQFGKPLYPILAHASVHALLMGFVMLLFVIKKPKILTIIAKADSTH